LNLIYAIWYINRQKSGNIFKLLILVFKKRVSDNLKSMKITEMDENNEMEDIDEKPIKPAVNDTGPT